MDPNTQAIIVVPIYQKLRQNCEDTPVDADAIIDLGTIDVGVNSRQPKWWNSQNWGGELTMIEETLSVTVGTTKNAAEEGRRKNRIVCDEKLGVNVETVTELVLQSFIVNADLFIDLETETNGCKTSWCQCCDNQKRETKNADESLEHEKGLYWITLFNELLFNQ